MLSGGGQSGAPVVLCGVGGVAWRGMAWHGVAWRGVAWRGVAWCRGVRCDVVRRGCGAPVIVDMHAEPHSSAMVVVAVAPGARVGLDVSAATIARAGLASPLRLWWL